jgi:outer membrane lipoprotein carrier protein
MIHRLLLVLILGLFAVPASAQPAVTLSEVQEAYQSLSGLEASFTQVMTSDLAGDSTRVEGTVLLSGNKYRVQTPQQTVITDGTTTWIHTPADSQVVINDAADEGSTVTPETFLTASADRYRVKSSSSTTRLDTPHEKLTVVAADESARFKEARLWVRRSDTLVTRMRATDRNGSILDLRLDEITVNPPVLREDTPFTFSPPEDAEVIDLRGA